MNTPVPEHTPSDKLLLSIAPECVERTGLSRTTLYNLIRSGELRSVKIGSRRLVPALELERFVRELVDAQRDSDGLEL